MKCVQIKKYGVTFSVSSSRLFSFYFLKNPHILKHSKLGISTLKFPPLPLSRPPTYPNPANIYPPPPPFFKKKNIVPCMPLVFDTKQANLFNYFILHRRVIEIYWWYVSSNPFSVPYIQTDWLITHVYYISVPSLSFYQCSLFVCIICKLEKRAREKKLFFKIIRFIAKSIYISAHAW